MYAISRKLSSYRLVEFQLQKKLLIEWFDRILHQYSHGLITSVH